MKILFVCTGNTCRSCMAEAIFNNLNEIEGISAISAGLSVIGGSSTSKNSAAVVMENLQFDISKRQAVQLTKELLEEADLILTMTSYMAKIIKREFKEYTNKVFFLNEYVSLEGDIVDPYGGSIDIYRTTYKDLKKSIEIVIEKIRTALENNK